MTTKLSRDISSMQEHIAVLNEEFGGIKQHMSALEANMVDSRESIASIKTDLSWLKGFNKWGMGILATLVASGFLLVLQRIH